MNSCHIIINMSEKRILKMYKELLKHEKESGSLEKYYNIKDKRLKIKIYMIDHFNFQFNIKFTRIPQTNTLRKKISKYILMDIAKYAEETINISIVVKFPHDYPFKPPHWSILEYNDNILIEDISKYYDYIIETHNEIYFAEEQWSPAIDFNRDFLDILVKILTGIKYTIDI